MSRCDFVSHGTCDVSVTEVSRVPVLTQADLMMKGISPALQEA